jgi:hypothetical protein
MASLGLPRTLEAAAAAAGAEAVASPAASSNASSNSRVKSMVVDGVIVCAMGVAEEDAAVAVAAGLGEALAAKSELNARRERSRFI